MKRVEYRRLSIKNFLSIGKDPVVVEFTKGIHIITGVNKDKIDRKNGVGKSAIACAFYFAHFGEAIRNIKKDLIVNDITNGKVEVILDVDVIEDGKKDSYKIVRNLKPSRLSVEKNGKDVTLSTIPKTTQYICDVLGVTQSLMTNCIVMTINDTIPFMAKPKGDKRKFIEDVFDLDVLGRMLTNLKKDFRETKKDVEVKEAQVEEIKRSVKNLKEQRNKLDQKKEERLAHYQKRLDANIKERDELKEKMASVKLPDTGLLQVKEKKLTKAIEKINEERAVLFETKVKQEVSTDQYVTERTKLTNAIDQGMCYECGREVTKEDRIRYDAKFKEFDAKIKHSKEVIDEYVKKIKQLDDQREKVTELLRANDKEITKHCEIAQDLKTDVKRLEQIDGWIDELKKDIETVKKENKEFVGNIKKEAERLRKEATDLGVLRDSFKVLESAKFVLGDEGVKTHIVKKLVDLLNTKLISYIRKLDGNCICRFNEYFEEEIINTKNKVRSYFNFSGAEKKAVDLGCLFAFSDIKRMQGGVSYNVSIYDELFDSSLDETGVNLVIDILNERVEQNNECVMIISHRKEALKAVTGEVIYLEKRGDITTRKQFPEE